MANGQRDSLSRQNIILLTITGILLASLFFNGCTDSTDPPIPDPSTIRGKVLDAAGNPVANAEIRLGFEPSFPTVEPSAKSTASSVMFNWDPLNGPLAQAAITDYCGNPVRMLCDGDCPADGELLWDGQDEAGLAVGDGVYFAQLVQPGRTMELALLMAHPTFDLVLGRGEPLTHTAADGSFAIVQDCLGFGQEFSSGGAGEPAHFEITRWIDLVARFAPNQSARLDSVYIDPDFGAEVTLRLAE